MQSVHWYHYASCLFPGMATETVYVCHSPTNSICCSVIRALVSESHYSDVVMGSMASQITSLAIDYSSVYSKIKETSKLRVTGICAGNSPGPVNSPHKWPVTQKMFPFDDVIMHISSVDTLTSTRLTTCINPRESL